jgi:hypothetical protein
MLALPLPQKLHSSKVTQLQIVVSFSGVEQASAWECAAERLDEENQR